MGEEDEGQGKHKQTNPEIVRGKGIWATKKSNGRAEI